MEEVELVWNHFGTQATTSGVRKSSRTKFISLDPPTLNPLLQFITPHWFSVMCITRADKFHHLGRNESQRIPCVRSPRGRRNEGRAANTEPISRACEIDAAPHEFATHWHVYTYTEQNKFTLHAQVVLNAASQLCHSCIKFVVFIPWLLFSPLNTSSHDKIADGIVG